MTVIQSINSMEKNLYVPQDQKGNPKYGKNCTGLKKVVVQRMSRN